MDVKVISRNEQQIEEYDYRDSIQIEVNGKSEFRVHDGEPEDNNMSRNFNDCYNIDNLIHMAFNAGKNGEDLNFTYEDEEE